MQISRINRYGKGYVKMSRRAKTAMKCGPQSCESIAHAIPTRPFPRPPGCSYASHKKTTQCRQRRGAATGLPHRHVPARQVHAAAAKDGLAAALLGWRQARRDGRLAGGRVGDMYWEEEA